GILQTLLTTPHRFLAYNNGITVVAEGIDVTPDNNRLLTIKGMQIVNGGQTTASIHRAYKENRADLSNVYVQAKLTVVPVAEFDDVVPDISRFSNTQNKVSDVDLRANNAYHIGVERMSRRLWTPGEQSKWFYERARGSYQTERARNGGTASGRQKFDREYPPSQRFTKEDLARYGNSWEGLPHIVSRGGQKNFVRFMESVPGVAKGWEMPADEFKQMVGKAILYRQTQRIALELRVPSFRVNVVNYTVSLITDLTARRIDLLKVWEAQGLSGSLGQLIREWLPQAAAVLTSSAGSRNPTEWFKAEQCWKDLKDVAKDWAIPDAVKGELMAIEGRGGSSYTVANDIARCLEIDAETWFRIQVWGSETGKLLDWQCGIANTLAGYAAGAWKRKPSEKQAKRGVEILGLAEEFLTGERK
ncbi:MAG: AIPR family protein, partial [bacterium]